jgi:hypothetical protein
MEGYNALFQVVRKILSMNGKCDTHIDCSLTPDFA